MRIFCYTLSLSAALAVAACQRSGEQPPVEGPRTTTAESDSPTDAGGAPGDTAGTGGRVGSTPTVGTAGRPGDVEAGATASQGDPGTVDGVGGSEGEIAGAPPPDATPDEPANPPPPPGVEVADEDDEEQAKPRADEPIVGRVIATDQTDIMIQPEEGGEVLTVRVDAGTRLTKKGQPVKRSTIKPDDRVRVTLDPEDGTARRIELL